MTKHKSKKSSQKQSDPAYALEKMHSIVRKLATGTGDARERVFTAVPTLQAIGPDDFPTPPLADEFSKIVKVIEKYRRPGGAGFSFKNKTAARIAARLYDLMTLSSSWPSN